ncbi:MAG: hypothetical protein WBP02_03630 [Gammaproteobacteria bacterium]
MHIFAVDSSVRGTEQFLADRQQTLIDCRAITRNDLSYALSKCHSFLCLSSRALLCTLMLFAYAEATYAEDTAPLEQTTTDTLQPDRPVSTEAAGNAETQTQTESESAPESETQAETKAEAETDSSDRTDPESACDRMQDLKEKETTWYDSTHAVVNTAFCEPAVWFDDFFASDRIFEEAAGTYVRWRNDFIYQQEDGFSFKTNLNFSVELPRISSKLKLIFEGDEDQALQDVLPGGQAESTNNTLGLRVDVKDTDRSSFNVSLSAKPRIRLRYRYTYPVRDDFLIRFTQEVQNEKGVNGARSRLDFEKAFLPLKLFRSTTEIFGAEDFSGVTWAQAFSLFKRISRKKSVSYEASVTGITEPQDLVTNYRLGIRYRRNIHRDWLFLEFTPDITWPVGLSEDRETIIKERRSVYSIIVRLEVHFGNAKNRTYSDYF